MDIEARLVEEIKRFEDLKNQIGKISAQIGGLTEQQRALYNQGLEVKGRIDALVAVKADQAKELENSQTAKLTLPVGVKPVPAPVAPVEAAPAPEAPVEKAPVSLEVQ